ncbi:dipeptide/oligopeptide/nickel ABC transporter ATP-binding protein [Spirochaetia bacterium]|nr:dipeptide/oligopeptide/nickel ABC transporter ATP-binding protein [Spirochaetia bacterium]
MSKLLEIKDLHVQYSTDESVVHALNGFDLAVDKGETLGLVGETGAGKTTMALSVLRLLPEKVGQISKGSIVYDGLEITTANKNELLKIRGAKVSMIFQDPMTSLNPTETVGSQILELLKLHYPEMTAIEKDKRVDEIIELVGIPASRKGNYPHEFSGGMKQRIVIAMALVCEPELLLADEPTTALDVTIQAQILMLMKQLKVKFNSAMIMITHDLGIVAEFCDSVAVVYGGEVVERGTVEDIFKRERNHPYTTGLFGCIPDLTTNSSRLTPIPGNMVDPTNLPLGCKFASRCPHHKESCEQQNPPMYTSGTHGIKCFLYKGNE